MATKIKCPKCDSTNAVGMSRVVGYFSLISNWGLNKILELKNRKKGNYKI